MLGNVTVGVVIGLLLFNLIVSPGIRFWETDSTDSETVRSGLTIYTDFGTGVQYVGTIQGGLHVRVDQDGKPITE